MFILVFLGTIFGKLLSYLTKEEIKLGEKYFKTIEIITLLLLSLFLFKLNIGFLLGLLVGFFLIRLLPLYLGLSVSLSSTLIVPSLTFIYLLINSRNPKWIKILEIVVLFILPFIAVESFIKGNSNFLLSFCSGSLLGPVAQLGRTFLKKCQKR